MEYSELSKRKGTTLNIDSPWMVVSPRKIPLVANFPKGNSLSRIGGNSSRRRESHAGEHMKIVRKYRINLLISMMCLIENHQSHGYILRMVSYTHGKKQIAWFKIEQDSEQKKNTSKIKYASFNKSIYKKNVSHTLFWNNTLFYLFKVCQKNYPSFTLVFYWEKLWVSKTETPESLGSVCTETQPLLRLRDQKDILLCYIMGLSIVINVQ